ncbi:MAG: Hint domain-containing protein, partial [Paracoccaceae bacterium]
MASEKIKISLKDGKLKGSDHSTNVNDDQIVTLKDGGALSNVQIDKFGTGTPTTPDAGPGGDDEFHLDLSKFDDDFSISVKNMDDQDAFFVDGAQSWSKSGTVYSFDAKGSDGKHHTVKIDVHSKNGSGDAGMHITCFAAGTLIETGTGCIPIETVAADDPVLCGDGRIRPVRWISRRKVSAAELRLHPEFRPVRIRRSALGENIPREDLVVSPQHRILIRDWRAEMMFAVPEVLVAAIHLVNDRDILRESDKIEVIYYHLMFDEHQIVWSNGLESESFHPGPEAIAGIDDAARHELLALFPELDNNPGAFGPTWCRALKAHETMA